MKAPGSGPAGVLPDQPLEALYIEMGDLAMVFRVRWWIGSHVDTRRMYDQVHPVLHRTLDAAGVAMPYHVQSLHLHDESEVTDGSAT